MKRIGKTLRSVALDAASRLADHAQVSISSFEQPGAPPEQQDYYWHQGQRDMALAKKLAEFAKKLPKMGRTLEDEKASQRP